MNKILVTSDTHGHIKALKKAIFKAGEFQYFFHLGDNTADVHYIEKDLLDRKIKIYQVRGNCDYMGAESYCEVNLCGQRIALLHGHSQRVKSTLLEIGLLADKKEVDAVLFGHTHIPKIEYSPLGRLLFNPGSLGEPRLGKPTFGLLTVNSQGIFPRILPLDD